jgi:hypothetical protein
MNSIDDTVNPVTVEPPNFATKVVAAVVAENFNLLGDDTQSDAGQEYCLRIVTWLDGSLLKDVELTINNANRFGQRLAELDLSLENFDFDGDGQAGLWDMQEALQLRSLLPHVNNDKVQKYARVVLTRFDGTVITARDEDDPYRQKTLENESNAFEFLVFLSDLGHKRTTTVTCLLPPRVPICPDLPRSTPGAQPALCTTGALPTCPRCSGEDALALVGLSIDYRSQDRC